MRMFARVLAGGQRAGDSGAASGRDLEQVQNMTLQGRRLRELRGLSAGWHRLTSVEAIGDGWPRLLATGAAEPQEPLESTPAANCRCATLVASSMRATSVSRINAAMNRVRGQLPERRVSLIAQGGTGVRHWAQNPDHPSVVQAQSAGSERSSSRVLTTLWLSPQLLDEIICVPSGERTGCGSQK